MRKPGVIKDIQRAAEEAINQLEYQSEYECDPHASHFADVIMHLLGFRDRAIDLYPELDSLGSCTCREYTDICDDACICGLSIDHCPVHCRMSEDYDE